MINSFEKPFDGEIKRRKINKAFSYYNQSGITFSYNNQLRKQKTCSYGNQ